MINNKINKINSASVFVEGVGFLSSAGKVDLPEIDFVEFSAMSGMAEHTVDTTVLKKMEAKFELNDINMVYFKAMQKRESQLVSFWVKAKFEGVDVIATIKGNIKKLKFPTIEVGKESKVSFDVNVRFYKLEMGSEKPYLIDVDNLICEIGGVDIWEDARSFHLG